MSSVLLSIYHSWLVSMEEHDHCKGEGFPYKSFLESPLMDEMVNGSFIHSQRGLDKEHGIRTSGNLKDQPWVRKLMCLLWFYLHSKRRFSFFLSLISNDILIITQVFICKWAFCYFSSTHSTSCILPQQPCKKQQFEFEAPQDTSTVGWVACWWGSLSKPCEGKVFGAGCRLTTFVPVLPLQDRTSQCPEGDGWETITTTFLPGSLTSSAHLQLQLSHFCKSKQKVYRALSSLPLLLFSLSHTNTRACVSWAQILTLT